MTQSEAREKLARTIEHTRGGSSSKIILLRASVAILLAGTVAESAAGKELTKISGKTIGERFSIEKSLAERLLEAIPTDEAGSIVTDTSTSEPAATKTPSKGGGGGKKGNSKKAADEPAKAEDLDEGSKPEGAADVL